MMLYGRQAQKLAKCLDAVAQSMDADPIGLMFLQRKYTPFSPRPVKDPKVFYDVHLGHVPQVSIRRRRKLKFRLYRDQVRFQAVQERGKAGTFIASKIVLGLPRFDSPEAVL